MSMRGKVGYTFDSCSTPCRDCFNTDLISEVSEDNPNINKWNHILEVEFHNPRKMFSASYGRRTNRMSKSKNMEEQCPDNKAALEEATNKANFAEINFMASWDFKGDLNKYLTVRYKVNRN